VTLNKSFFLLTVAFLALCTLAVALAVAFSSDAVGSATEGVAVIAFAVAAAALWAQGRHDLDAVLTLLSVFLLLVTVCMVIYHGASGPVGEPPALKRGRRPTGRAPLGFRLEAQPQK
jgi:hypothetical protein